MSTRLPAEERLIPATFTIRPDQMKRLRALARQEGLSTSCWIRRLLDKSRGFRVQGEK